MNLEGVGRENCFLYFPLEVPTINTQRASPAGLAVGFLPGPRLQRKMSLFGACWLLSTRSPCVPAHEKAHTQSHALTASSEGTRPLSSASMSCCFWSPGPQQKCWTILFSWQTPDLQHVVAVVLGMLLQLGQNSAGKEKNDSKESLRLFLGRTVLGELNFMGVMAPRNLLQIRVYFSFWAEAMKSYLTHVQNKHLGHLSQGRWPLGIISGAKCLFSLQPSCTGMCLRNSAAGV